jgi:hypothetical protein
MTYSIVARDPETGELGVAVQSRAFNTGAVVPWSAPGVGVVATQSYTELSYGPLGLELLRDGKPPSRHSPSSLPRTRIPNTARSRSSTPKVGWPCTWARPASRRRASLRAMDSARIDALDAAEAAGGDWRGRQAGGILVVAAEGEPWAREFDLRVDDHSDPLGELRRLVRMRHAYRAMRGPPGPDEQDLAVVHELDRTLAGIFGATATGQVTEARALLQPLLEAEPRWADFIRTLADRELLPHAAELLED